MIITHLILKTLKSLFKQVWVIEEEWGISNNKTKVGNKHSPYLNRGYYLRKGPRVQGH